MKTALFCPVRFEREEVLSRLNGWSSSDDDESHYLFFSNAGANFALSTDIKKPAHIYAPLDSTFKRAAILKEFPVLYGNDFTLAWLANMVVQMGEGASLCIEIPNERSNKNRNLVTSDMMRSKFPRSESSGAIKKDGDWLILEYRPELIEDIDALPTLYRFVCDGFEEFNSIYSSSKTQCPVGEGDESIRDKALRTYIYSLFGANQKTFVLDHLIGKYFGEQTIKGIDIGAGYGFLACELALKGHQMTIVDHVEDQMMVLGKWLAGKCCIEDRINMLVDKMENTGNFPGEGTFDMVSFFGCLLAVQRQYVPEILQGAMKLLKPGGILILHENPKEAGKPGSLQYEERFEADELYKYMTQNAGKPVCHNMFTAKEVDFESTKNKLIMAVIQK